MDGLVFLMLVLTVNIASEDTYSFDDLSLLPQLIVNSRVESIRIQDILLFNSIQAVDEGAFSLT